MLGLMLVVAALMAEPASTRQAPSRALSAFAPVLEQHLDRVLPLDRLPAGRGQPVASGVFVTLTPERMQIFDRDVAVLDHGRLIDKTAAKACRSGCPQGFYEVFRSAWLTMAVEAASFDRGLASRVLFAADAEIPASTLLQAAYAAAESRPVQPPAFSILVSSPAGGLQAVEFHLMPPEGLRLQRGQGAALGLTITLRGGWHYEVAGNDPELYKPREVPNLAGLRPMMRALKKKYPGKQTVVFVPENDVTTRELIELSMIVRESFPRLVLSQSKELVLP